MPREHSSLPAVASAKAGRYDRFVADPKVRDRIQSDSEVEERVDHPRLWKVLLHNDDYTTQEFVVWVLESIFHLPHADAFAIMMRVHQAGVGVAGLFTRDVAETKVKATQQLAEQHEYPLLVTIEPDAGEPRE
jgi:ATP-dependent Clp protease adaptor protein ClpS